MRKFPSSYPHPFPSVKAARDAVLSMHSVNINAWRPSAEDREIADNFDVADHLAKAREAQAVLI